MIERLAYRYLKGLTNIPAQDSASLHLLTKEELNAIQAIVRESLLSAAFIGVIGVLLLYIPQYYFPTLFYEFPVYLSVINSSFSFPITGLIYGITLAYLEIYVLMAINIKAVFKIAKVCGFPDKNDPDYDKHIESLMRVGLEKEDKTTTTYGLNPLQGASKWTLFLFLVLSRLKATISNFVAKIILRRILGRYALRTIIDMVGVPVFAFWNAYASYIVIQETKVRIMAPNLIRQLCRDLARQFKSNPLFSAQLYDTLQYIAMAKRRYHHNHFLLAKNILITFDVPLKENHSLDENYLHHLKTLDPDVKEGIVKVLMMGFVLDGNLSVKEKAMVASLHEQGIIPYDVDTVENWIVSFVSGKGLNGLVFFG
jgi:hypothetical protein